MALSRISEMSDRLAERNAMLRLAALGVAGAVPAGDNVHMPATAA
jgi:hypothetical protein